MWRYPRDMETASRRLIRAWSWQRVRYNGYRNGLGGMVRDVEYFGTDELGKARIGLLTMGVGHLEGLQSNCTQAFHALPRLIIGDELPWPFLAMARICLESCARFCYVIDPAISPEQRLMRIAAFMVWSNGEELTMSNVAKNSDAAALEEMRKEIHEASEKIMDLVNKAGFEVEESRIVDPSGAFKAVSTKLGAIDMVKAEFPEMGEESYRRMSGFVHGAPWMLNTATRRFAKRLSSPAITGKSVVWGFYMAGLSLSKMMHRSADYAGIPLGKVPARLNDLEALCKREMEAIGRTDRPKRFAGPGRGWVSRFSPVIIRAWGHEPMPKPEDKAP